MSSPVTRSATGISIVHLILRRINRQTLRLVIPAQYQKAHDLGEGDHVIWIPETDGVRLKFVKTRQLAEPSDAEAT
jgi:hypothetical protein